MSIDDPTYSFSICPDGDAFTSVTHGYAETDVGNKDFRPFTLVISGCMRDAPTFKVSRTACGGFILRIAENAGSDAKQHKFSITMPLPIGLDIEDNDRHYGNIKVSFADGRQFPCTYRVRVDENSKSIRFDSVNNDGDDNLSFWMEFCCHWE